MATGSTKFDSDFTGYLNNTSITSALKLTGAMSCRVYFKTTGGSTFPYFVTVGQDHDNTYFECAYTKLGIGGGQNIYESTYVGAGQTYADGTPNLSLENNAWHEAVWTRSAGGVWVLYVDKVLQTLDDHSANTLPTTTGAVMQVGAQFGGTGVSVTAFVGYLAEISLWDKVLDQTDINNGYNVPTSPSAPGLVGYWPLRTDYLDKTSNGNHLTGHGSLSFDTPTPFVANSTKTNAAIIST